MEFRINKIEPDLRQKINEERGEGKVHSKKSFVVNKDKEKDEQQNDRKNKNKKLVEHSDDSNTHEDIPQQAGDPKREITENGKGHFIDIRK